MILDVHPVNPWLHTMACNIFFFLIRLGETHQISWFLRKLFIIGDVSKPFKTIQNRILGG
jgi:hypothetical protein